jgi:hypothetical protein
MVPIQALTKEDPLLQVLSVLPAESVGQVAQAPRVAANRLGRLRVDPLDADGR